MGLGNLQPWWLRPEIGSNRMADTGGYYWLALFFDLEVDSRLSDNRGGNQGQGLARAQMKGKAPSIFSLSHSDVEL